jgi:hypothetical protein
LPMSRWHIRLGHPSSFIVQQVVNKNKLPCFVDSSGQSLCDVCQEGKSYQLPYHRSSSVSKFPLELVLSDV